MKTLILTTTALALCALPMTAHSEETQTRSNIKTRGDTGTYVEYSSDAETITKKEIKRTAEKAKNSVKKAADQVTAAVDKKPAAPATGLAMSEAKVSKNNSADNMIGKPVMNANGERVGSVHDIILASNGDVKGLIVADGGLMSLGDKKAAFDYSVVNGRDLNGGVLTTISEEQINAAKKFSYEAKADADNSVQIIDAKEISARQALTAPVIDEAGKKIGSVKDIAIENGDVNKIVIAYDQILGLGGKKIGLSYNDVSFQKDDGGKLTLRLTETQAATLISSNAVN